MPEHQKVLHFADTHLDDRNFEEKQACMGKIVDEAVSSQPDLIVFAGDAFHSREVRAESKAAALFFLTIKQLSHVAPVVVLSGTLSHDGAAPMLLDKFHNNNKVMVSNYPEQIVLKDGQLFREWVRNDIDALISMVPPPTKQFFPVEGLSIEETNQAISNGMTALFTGFAAAAVDYDCPHILVGHFNVAGSQISPTQILIGKDIEVSRGQLELAHADLVCLGHIHKAQQIGEEIFYSGSTQTNTWGELDDKGFYIHTIVEEPIPEHGVQRFLNSSFILTPSRKRIWIKHDFTAMEDDVREIDALLYTYSDDVLNGSVVRVDLKIFKDDAGKLDKTTIKAFFDSAGAHQVEINITAIARETVRSVEVSKAVTLADKVQALAATRGETLAGSIHNKADELETSDPAELESRWTNYFNDIELRAEALEKEGAE